MSGSETQSHLESDARLSIEHLGVELGGQQLVHDVSLAVESGAIHCLVGDSGSGKTLTSLAAIGLLPPGASTSGTIRLDGIEQCLLTVAPAQWSEIRGRSIGYVGQNAIGCLHPAYTVGFQLVEAIRRHQKVTKAAALEIALAELQAVDLEAATVARSHPAELSGGMCQRVALAMALCNRPPVLIADEPTTALDHDTQEHVLALIRLRVERDGLGVLLITHDQEVVERHADHVTTIVDGRSTPGRAATPTLAMRSREHSAAAEPGVPVLEIDNVSKTYRRPGWRRHENPVLSDVTIHGGAGATIGLVGRSGAGKTTLARIVAGLLVPTAGSVRIAGRTVAGPGCVGRIERAGLVQYVFQDPYGSLNPRRSSLDQVADPLVAAGIGRAEAADRAEEMLAEVGLTSQQITRRPTALSGGQCQRVGIARALIRRPHVVVLDEPVSALDWSIRAEILELLEDLQEATGAFFLLIAHERPLVERQCDRIFEVQDQRVRELEPVLLTQEITT